MSEFNLKELQEAVIGVPKDLILPEDHIDQEREFKHKSIRKIVNLYRVSRNNNRVYPSTYQALTDINPYVRAAACDVICENGNVNSFEYLFKALEDEEDLKIKQKIAFTIDFLEKKLQNKSSNTESDITFVKSMKLISYSK